MEARSGFDIVISSGPIASAAVDLLAFTTFGDPSKDATFKAFDAQLKGAFASSFTPLDRSTDVFSWDPV